MLNETSVKLGRVRSVIRELFEYGKIRKAEIGEDKVYDFSLGNPSVPAPAEVREKLLELVQNVDPVSLHGYTSAQGDFSTRKAIADNLNMRFHTSLSADNLYMTCGAAASLCITFNAILNKGDEVIAFAPFFPEYTVFVSHAGGVLKSLKCDPVTFMPDLALLEKSLTPKTKAVLINSPNNPSGVVYGEDIIRGISEILLRYKKKTGNTVFFMSDEPYRELVFGNVKVPFIMNYYDDSIVCYSFSKSLSLPGERIGYIAVCNKSEYSEELYSAVCGAGRALGYVCAPVLFQKLVAAVPDKTSDISVYKSNRDVLCTALTEYGFTLVKPDGAFYLFVKSPTGNATEFAEKAKEFELLLVPADSFGVEGYVRISYCVSPETVRGSLEAFRALAAFYKLTSL